MPPKRVKPTREPIPSLQKLAKRKAKEVYGKGPVNEWIEEAGIIMPKRTTKEKKTIKTLKDQHYLQTTNPVAIDYDPEHKYYKRFSRDNKKANKALKQATQMEKDKRPKEEDEAVSELKMSNLEKRMRGKRPTAKTPDSLMEYRSFAEYQAWARNRTQN